MSPEDMQRFEVALIGHQREITKLLAGVADVVAELAAASERATATLAELAQRAEEHGEMCR